MTMEYHQEENNVELSSLIGKLSFAAKVILASCIFLRRLISYFIQKVPAPCNSNSRCQGRYPMVERLPGWNAVSLMLQQIGKLQQTWTYSQMHPVHWALEIIQRSMDHGPMVKGAALKVDPMERTFCNHRSSGHMGQPMAEEDSSLLDNQEIVHVWQVESPKNSALVQLCCTLFFLAAKNSFNNTSRGR